MFSAFAITGLLTLVTASIMALVMFAGDRSRIQLMWGFFCILVAIWGFGAFKIGAANTPAEALLWWKIAYVGVIFIPVLFTHFVHLFLGKRLDLLIRTLYVISAMYLLANLFTNLFIGSVHRAFDSLFFLSPSPLYNSYMMLWILLIVYTHTLLAIEFSKAAVERRRQIGYFFLGSFVGFFGGSFSFLPVYNINIYPYENAAVALYPVIMGYAILRYKLMSLKVVAAQAFVGSLWVFLFARAILAPSGSEEQIVNIIALGLSVIIGLLLIRSVYREIEQRETIEAQAHELDIANKQQENLLHFLSHEIKGYLTKNEAAFAAITEGDFGSCAPPLEDMAKAALADTRMGVATVKDILDAANLKKGTVTFEMKEFDFSGAVRAAAESLRQSVEEKGLALTYNVLSSNSYNVLGDEAKLRDHVVRNILDNSIRYTPQGSITLNLSRSGKWVRLVVVDTGVGITKEDRQKLFQAGVRGKDSMKVNVHSTSYGLFIAKSIVDAHGGNIWASSDGAGKGSRFVIELPAAPLDVKATP